MPLEVRGGNLCGSDATGIFYEYINFDGFAKSRKPFFSVIPAEAGIQEYQGLLDPGFRRGDDFDDFLRAHQS